MVTPTVRLEALAAAAKPQREPAREPRLRQAVGTARTHDGYLPLGARPGSPDGDRRLVVGRRRRPQRREQVERLAKDTALARRPAHERLRARAHAEQRVAKLVDLPSAHDT
jgi:hypothetical protein